MIIYLVKSSMCLLLFLVIYHLLFEQEKMHKFNRFFLLGAILFSLTIPLLELNLGFSYSNTQKTLEDFQLLASKTEFTKTKGVFNFFLSSTFLVVFYSFGLLVMLYRYIKNLYGIYSLTKENTVIRKEGYSIILLENLLPPHSFFNMIFLNKELFKNGKIAACIMEHELSHIKQRHSFDIVFIEFIHMLFWFNPLLFFYKKAIKLNHEFIADSAALELVEDSSEYIDVLLKNIFRNNPSYLASSVNYSLTKKRFIMMTKNKSKTKMICKQLLVIPLFVFFTLLFSTIVPAQEKGASRELMKEYTSKSKDNIIKREDVKRLEYIYSLMSDKQKKSVTPIPPPPPKVVNGWTVSAKSNDSPFMASFPRDAEFYINGQKVSIHDVEKLSKSEVESAMVKKNENGKSLVYIKLR